MTPKDQREARLAARLRDNLKRRKAQARETVPPPSGEAVGVAAVLAERRPR